MAIPLHLKKRIKTLKREYDQLREGKESLLKIIDEAELPESVFNSNAIENSTLTLKETERILLEMEVARNVSVREVFEAKNLARVMEYLKRKAIHTDLTKEFMLLLHNMLLTNIDDAIAGRFRTLGEYVRVGTHIAPPPEDVDRLVADCMREYKDENDNYSLDVISKFHLDFELAHPFCDGNGRIGRVLINYQLYRAGFPMIIVRDKEKQRYYKAFQEYRITKNTKSMEKIVTKALLESLHKRLAYLRGESVVTVVANAKQEKKSVHALLNAARRQTIPAFREAGVWKIGVGKK